MGETIVCLVYHVLQPVLTLGTFALVHFLGFSSTVDIIIWFLSVGKDIIPASTERCLEHISFNKYPGYGSISASPVVA